MSSKAAVLGVVVVVVIEAVCGCEAWSSVQVLKWGATVRQVLSRQAAAS